MPKHFVAVIVSVPLEWLSDDDPSCLAAGSQVCSRLESHLEEHGHTIDSWIRGGCEEDWGVYYESRRDGERPEYTINFFPHYTDEGLPQMILQYHPKTPWYRRLVGRWLAFAAGDPMHDTMEAFGKKFASYRMLTEEQFEEEY